MNTLEKVLAALGAIDLIGAIVAGFIGQLFASIMMLGLLLISWLGWITWEVVALRKKDRASFWRYKYLPEPLNITFRERTRRKIDSNFVLWERCTLVIWVYVSPKGIGLRRGPPSNHYLLAHHTGEVREYVVMNMFSLRYSHTGNWEVRISNGKAQYPAERIEIPDGLQPGWHQFMLAWDKTEQLFVFQIDGLKGANRLLNVALAYWPEQPAPELTVGAWVTEEESAYCETKLFELWISDDFLDSTHPAVREHLKHKPRV